MHAGLCSLFNIVHNGKYILVVTTLWANGFESNSQDNQPIHPMRQVAFCIRSELLHLPHDDSFPTLTSCISRFSPIRLSARRNRYFLESQSVHITGRTHSLLISLVWSLNCHTGAE